LVDKIPNLGGLARTSEIFAAQSLIVPDLSVTKMDIFQSISVGAADWIDIQEVKEEVREYSSREEYNCDGHCRSSISM
jgi:tRNA guanosine-2'-O-methyltransferase